MVTQPISVEVRIGSVRPVFDTPRQRLGPTRKVLAVATFRSTTISRPRRDRDSALRAAHQEAFAKIARARTSADHRAEVALAVDELIDACEAYTEGR